MKVGVLTFFYNTTNYGGMLQAYALTKVLTDLGISVEQIRYDINSASSMKKKIRRFARKCYCLITNPIGYIHDLKIRGYIELKKKAFFEFARENVPYSSEVYSDETIKESSNLYDGFVAGSDQIWSGSSKVYFLEFVQDNKIKVSYAASISRDNLSEKQKKIIGPYLTKFKGISVREEKAKELLMDIGIHSDVVLDPTLLIDPDEWGKISSNRLIPEKYAFCYLLGDNSEQRKAVAEYAKKNAIKTVFIPFMNNHYSNSDQNFGDIKIYSPSPKDFLSLIKYADCVFTDSYHASIFSCLFQKDFVVFNRTSIYGSMSSRFNDLLSMFNLSDHYMEKVSPITHAVIKNDAQLSQIEVFRKAKRNSIAFIKNHLLVSNK